MSKRIDMTGQKFGRLTVVKFSHTKHEMSYWSCRCECGAEKVTTRSRLLNGETKSCGCLKKEVDASRIPIDMTGERYGRLIVIKFSHIKGKGISYWSCKCECGIEKNISRRCLISGNTKSCGCLSKENVKKRATKHGLSHTKIYQVWANMKTRCNNENDQFYSDYGGRGIKVSDDWLDFPKFHSDMSPAYKEGLSIERIDVNGNYELSNCKWATPLQQVTNRRNNIIVYVNGERKILKEACAILGLKYNTIHGRIKRGIEPQKAIK